MKRIDPRVLLAASLLAFGAHAEPIDRAAWLAGCWKNDDPQRVGEEQWMAPRAGLMLGMGRTASQTRVATYEHMRIEAEGDDLVFTSKPSGKPEDSFRARPGDADEIVFENLAHPFPQRIIYRRSGPSALAARIEGLRGDKLVGIDFPMRRVPCL